MRGGNTGGRIGLAIMGLLVVFAVAMYFINPFRSPSNDPRARIIGYTVYRMPSRSMEPTLKEGALFIVSTATLRDRDPVPGDHVIGVFNGFAIKN